MTRDFLGDRIKDHFGFIPFGLLITIVVAMDGDRVVSIVFGFDEHGRLAANNLCLSKLELGLRLPLLVDFELCRAFVTRHLLLIQSTAHALPGLFGSIVSGELLDRQRLLLVAGPPIKGTDKGKVTLHVAFYVLIGSARIG